MIKEGDVKICPACGGPLNHYDGLKRKTRNEYGQVKQIYIQRYKCCNCGKVHRELPNSLLPYKQFRADIIAKVLDGSASVYDLEFEDFPCEATMKRWKSELGDKQ